jgi:predicted ATPase
VERGTFVGRVKLLDEIARHVDGGARLVTLSGPEGIGKTRLALRAAALELPRFGARGGVWFIDGSELEGPMGLLRELLLLLGLMPEAGADLEATTRRTVRAVGELGACLIVVDTGACPGDRVRALAATTRRLLDEAPDVRFLFTTRHALGLDDEKVVKVGSLKLAKQAQQDAKSLANAESVQLFVERASEAKRGYSPSPVDLHAIAQITRQLDGVPLAIEIAAARLRALSAPELLERLPRKVGLLVEGQPGGSWSQRSALAGAVAWSLDLLPAWEQEALSQAAVFRGGFDVLAASEVIDLSAFADSPAVPDALEALLEKALLRVQELPSRWRTEELAAEERRLDMPSVVREFAEARLGSDTARDALANRHATHYLKVCGGWAEGVDGHGGLTLRRNLELETENLTAAVRRALAADPQTLASITTALRGALALEPVLTTRGPHELFLDILNRALEPAEVVGVPFALRARALEARGRARRARHELAASLEDLDEALACARRAKDKLLEARAIANIGTHHLLVHKLDLAANEYDAALRLLDELGERKVYARQLGFYGLLDHERGELDGAVQRTRDAITILRDVGDRRWEAILTSQLGNALLEKGALDDARATLKRALAVHKELHNKRQEAITLSWLGDVEAEAGDTDQARAHWEKALALHRQVGDPRGEAVALGRLGVVALRNKLRAVAEELFLRAREIVERLDDEGLTGMLAVLERRESASRDDVARRPEIVRAAARVARALG